MTRKTVKAAALYLACAAVVTLAANAQAANGDWNNQEARSPEGVIGGATYEYCKIAVGARNPSALAEDIPLPLPPAPWIPIPF